MKTVKALVVASLATVSIAVGAAEPVAVKTTPNPVVAPTTTASDAKKAERPKAKTPKDKQKEKEAKAEAAKK